LSGLVAPAILKWSGEAGSRAEQRITGA